MKESCPVSIQVRYHDAPVSNRLLARLALDILGLSLFWQYLRGANIEGVFSESQLFFLEMAPSRWLLAFYVAAVVIALLLLVLNRGNWERSRTEPTVFVGITASLACLCSVGVSAWHPQLAPLAMLQVVECLALAASFVLLSCQWATELAEMAKVSGKAASLLVCLSCLLSIIGAPVIYSGPLPTSIVRSLIPAVCVLCLLATRRCGEKLTGNPVPDRNSREMAWSVVAALTIAAFAKGLWGGMPVGDPDLGLQVKNAIGIIEIVLVVGLCLWSRSHGVFLLWGQGLLVICLAVSLVVTTVVDSDLTSQVCLGFITSSRACLEVFVLSTVALGVMGKPPRDAILLLVIPETVAYLAGSVAAQVTGEAGFTGTLSAVALVLSLSLLVGTIVSIGWLATRKIDGGATDSTESVSSDARGVALPTAGQQTPLERALAGYALTPRELDVARHLLAGDSAKQIAREECISLNTVQSHSKSLYRKLGIHSRQGLIELVSRSPK